MNETRKSQSQPGEVAAIWSREDVESLSPDLRAVLEDLERSVEDLEQEVAGFVVRAGEIATLSSEQARAPMRRPGVCDEVANDCTPRTPSANLRRLFDVGEFSRPWPPARVSFAGPADELVEKLGQTAWKTAAAIGSGSIVGLLAIWWIVA